MKNLIFLLFLLGYQPKIVAWSFYNDNFLSMFDNSSSKYKSINFNNLIFHINSEAECRSLADEKFFCRTQCFKLTFNKKKLNNKNSLSLLRFVRKKKWQNKGVINYQESRLTLGLGEVFLQNGQYYELNNVLSPVLIRAFDVVEENGTVLSVQEELPLKRWLQCGPEINKFEISIKKK